MSTFKFRDSPECKGFLKWTCPSSSSSWGGGFWAFSQALRTSKPPGVPVVLPAEAPAAQAGSRPELSSLVLKAVRDPGQSTALGGSFLAAAAAQATHICCPRFPHWSLSIFGFRGVELVGVPQLLPSSWTGLPCHSSPGPIAVHLPSPCSLGVLA